LSRVGEKIKEARLKSGMTQKALGKKLGVSDKYINEIEMGKKVVQESFIDKAAKILNADLNDISMVVTDEVLEQEARTNKVIEKKIVPKVISEVSDVWTDAFSSVLKKVSIYDYNLDTPIGGKELPNYSNKVEGYPADKVLYLKVENNDMAGFRIMKGDLAFGHIVKEFSNNGIFLIEYKGERILRQIKTIGNSKVLLVSNQGAVITETVAISSIIVIAKIERIEIQL
jgi:transcriptional regulator with XRE-family HTH domain